MFEFRSLKPFFYSSDAGNVAIFLIKSKLMHADGIKIFDHFTFTAGSFVYST